MKLLRSLLCIAVVIALGAIISAEVWAHSSCLLISAKSDSEDAVESVTSITVIVDGMKKSRSGAT